MEIEVNHLTRVEGHGDLYAQRSPARCKRPSSASSRRTVSSRRILRGHDPEEVGPHRLPHLRHLRGQPLLRLAAGLRAGPGLGDCPSSRASCAASPWTPKSSPATPSTSGSSPPRITCASPACFPWSRTTPRPWRAPFGLKKTGYDLGEVVVGRHTHPVSAVPGGFTCAPDPWALEKIRGRLIDLRPDLAATVDLVPTLDSPRLRPPHRIRLPPASPITTASTAAKSSPATATRFRTTSIAKRFRSTSSSAPPRSTRSGIMTPTWSAPSPASTTTTNNSTPPRKKPSRRWA